MTLDKRALGAKDRFVAERGTWGPTWESIASLDPDFLDAYRELSMTPIRKGQLSPKVQEFIFLAVDANSTHLFMQGVEPHLKKALEYGATRGELMEVLELVSTLGIHAMNIGVPILTDVMEELGMRGEPAKLSEHQLLLKEQFSKERGYWHSFWDEMLELDPEMFEAYLKFSSVPWRTGVLEPKIKELIYIAFDTAATHLYTPGLRLHIKNALEYGATPQEVLEVMEIASTIGIHAVMLTAPVLDQLTSEVPA